MGQFGPEALLGADGRPLPGASVTVPDGYTASVDGAGNLTVSGPAADSVPTTITPAGGSPFTVNLRVEQSVADLLTRGDASATYAVIEDFERRPAGGTTTPGDVLILGRQAHAPANIGTSIVAGGAPNHENVVGGNTANVDTATSNLTGAPTLTAPDGNWNAILGGYDNVVNGWANVVVAYHAAVEAGANHCTVSGGSKHDVSANTAYGTIGGGTANLVTGNNPTVGGGTTNKATANQATVGGGDRNEATALNASVGGGALNRATNNQATVSGGQSCTASGNSSAIGGGLTNSATATGATVPGGRDNTASGAYAVATGRGAVAVGAGQHAHAAGAFAVAGDAQVSRWSLKRATTDATVGILGDEGGLLPTLPENTTWAFEALVVARRADVDGEYAAWKVTGLVNRDAGSTGAIIGTPTVTQIAANTGNAWTFAVTVSTAGALALRGTGEAGKTIRWVATLDTSSVSG